MFLHDVQPLLASTRAVFFLPQRCPFYDDLMVLPLPPPTRSPLCKVTDLGLGGVRYHGIFDDDMGPVVTGPPGRRVYNWTLIDQSWDYQVRGGGITVRDDADRTYDLSTASGHGTSLRPRGAPCSPARSHNRHSRTLAPSSAP